MLGIFQDAVWDGMKQGTLYWDEAKQVPYVKTDEGVLRKQREQPSLVGQTVVLVLLVFELLTVRLITHLFIYALLK